MRTKRLAEVCTTFKSNILINKIDGNSGDYPVFGAKGVVANVDYYQQAEPYISVIKWGAGVGRAELRPAFSSIVATMLGILPNRDIDIDWLCYLLQFMHLEQYTTNAVVPNLYFKDYCNKEIHVPDIREQRLRAGHLLKIQKIIDKRQKQLKIIDDLIKARFVEMFGDPVLNPNNYPVHQLSDYIEFLTSGSRGWAQYCVDDGAEWFITIKNVKDCRISVENIQPIDVPDNAEARRTRVQEGDLLISITADLGRTGVVTKEIAEHGAYINQHLTCIRLNRGVLEPLYVAYFMESEAGKEQFASKNQSAVKAGLNFNSINTLRLLVPPKAKQKEFIDFVSQIDKSKSVIQKSLNQTQLLFDSLMQEYFG